LTWHKHVYQEREKAKPLEVTLLVNSAACNLKLSKFSGAFVRMQAVVWFLTNRVFWYNFVAPFFIHFVSSADAIDNCTKALALDTKNVKALSRRAQALIGKSEFAAAKQDLVAAIKLEPSNKQLRADYDALLKKIAQYEQGIAACFECNFCRAS
jgi:tetratricopeptide (TPR) repeat protein